MINCAQCGEPIKDGEGTKVEKHASWATRNFVFHSISKSDGVESCADTFETGQLIRLGSLKLVEPIKKNGKGDK